MNTRNHAAFEQSVANPVIGYLSGPVDGREVHRRYLENGGIDYLGTSYMREFFEVCDELDVKSVVVTSHHGEQYAEQHGNVKFANFPKPDAKVISGLSYHMAMIRWTNAALAYLHEQGCTHIVLTDAQDYWFCVARSPIRNAKLIVALHCAIEPAFAKPPLARRLLHWLNRRRFYRSYPAQILSASPLISRQARDYAGLSPVPVRLFLPLYNEQDFQSAYQSYPQSHQPFNLLFAGRIIANKGVFDLLEMMERIRKASAADVCLHIAGDGPDMERLRQEVSARGLSGHVVLHGYCGRAEMLKLLELAHAVIVPTRSDFAEGFAMICAEAILAGRPLITSKVCPALELVRAASLEAERDQVQSYTDAVLRLVSDPALVASKRQATAELRKPFFDPAQSYGAKLEASLLEVGV